MEEKSMLSSLARSTALGLAVALALGLAQAASAGSISQVQKGMPEAQVRDIAGAPDSQVTYPTWKQFMPWNWGGGGQRVEYKYKGQGRVIMETRAWTGQLRVVQVVADNAEDGF
jgi:YD repeat-containing protein